MFLQFRGEKLVKITIKDVAKEAGVSISAVSYIMNDSKEKKYSPETILKVKKAAEKLNYIPNNIARGMRSKKSYAIGYVSYWNFENRVSVKILRGIVKCSDKLGYSVVVCNTNEKSFDDTSYIEYYRRGRIDGIVFMCPVEYTEFNENIHIKAMSENHIPFVLISPKTQYKNISDFSFDFESATYVATKKLCLEGEKDITYVYHDYKELQNEVVLRKNGYKKAVSEFDLCGKYVSDDNIEKEISNFKAVVTDKSDTAVLIINSAVKHGLKIPENFKLVAGNTEPYTDKLCFPIESSSFPFEKIGYDACDCIVRQIGGESITVHKKYACMI